MVNINLKNANLLFDESDGRALIIFSNYYWYSSKSTEFSAKEIGAKVLFISCVSLLYALIIVVFGEQNTNVVLPCVNMLVILFFDESDGGALMKFELKDEYNLEQVVKNLVLQNLVLKNVFDYIIRLVFDYIIISSFLMVCFHSK